MDEVFGIGELIEEDTQIAKKMAYTSKDLVGLKVEHDMVNNSLVLVGYLIYIDTLVATNNLHK